MTKPLRVLTALPVIPAANLDESLAWWDAKLGFPQAFRVGNYAGASRNGVMIHLAEAPPELARQIGEQTMLRFVVSDAQAMHDEFLSRGGTVHPNGALGMRPWGQLEFGVVDPCGVCVTFQQANHAE